MHAVKDLIYQINMSKTESFFLFTLKVKELKKTANYFNTVTNESFDLLQQYPNLINENRIFDEEINDDEIDSNDKSIKEEGIKLIFLSLLIYFEEFINSIITEIILQYKVSHIKQISNISKANFDKRYEFIRDSLDTGSINKNSNNINICIIIRNSIVHSSKAI